MSPVDPPDMANLNTNDIKRLQETVKADKQVILIATWRTILEALSFFVEVKKRINQLEVATSRKESTNWKARAPIMSFHRSSSYKGKASR